MTPTNELRFVERIVPAPEHGEGIGKTVRILQQKWEHWEHGYSQDTYKFEWRDVVVAKEPTP